MRKVINFFRRHVVYHYYTWQARRHGPEYKSYLLRAMSARMGGSKVTNLKLSRSKPDDLTWNRTTS